MKRVSCGLDVHVSTEICCTLKLATDERFEFVCLPLVHPRFKREFTLKCKNRNGPFTRPDSVLKSSEWSMLIAGKVSPYFDFESECLSEQHSYAFQQELTYGSHLEVPAIVIPLRSSDCCNLAKIINSNIVFSKPIALWIEVPLIDSNKEALIWRSDVKENNEESTWEWWNKLYTLCNSDGRLGVALELSKTLPPQEELDRWLGEPIKCLIIRTSTFLTNKMGRPMLSQLHQAFVKLLLNLDVQIVIKGNCHHFTLNNYQKYIDYLWQENMIQKSNEEAASCLHYNETSEKPENYEIPGKDGVKFREYTKAIVQALIDKVPEEEKTRIVNIMILNAGKTPLITTTIQAAIRAKKKIKIYVYEKDPYVTVTLQACQEDTWHDLVEIIPENNLTDFPRIIDILLSDLLGSFGDNESCPEILSQAHKILKEGGISIPESYSSYLCPVQSSKMYSDLKISKSSREEPYVFAQKNKYDISPPQKLFDFYHHNFNSPINNSRYKTLTFDVSQNSVLHGFAGYFETTLYKDIKLSIVPENHTPRLHSWIPIVFPLSVPVQLKTGNQIEVAFWRLVNSKKVWYEWTITKPVALPIHNPNGRSSCFNLQ